MLCTVPLSCCRLCYTLWQKSTALCFLNEFKVLPGTAGPFLHVMQLVLVAATSHETQVWVCHVRNQPLYPTASWHNSRLVTMPSVHHRWLAGCCAASQWTSWAVIFVTLVCDHCSAVCTMSRSALDIRWCY